MSDLITTSNIVPAEVFVKNGLDPILAIVRKKIDDFVPDMETANGRKEIKSFAYKVAQSKTLLDDMGKELTADMDATVKGVRAERKRVKDILNEWRDEVRKPVTEWEDAEKEREAKLDALYADLQAMGVMTTGSTVEEIEGRIVALSAWDIDEDWGDRQNLAQTTKEKALEQLQERLADRQQYEEQQEELAALRIKEAETKAENERLERENAAAEEATREAARIKHESARAEEDRIEVERQRVEREEQIRCDARATALAESQAQEAAERERHEREKQEALDREARAIEDRDQAAENERNRIAAEKLAEDEAAKEREANKRHRGKINRAARKVLIDAGLNEDDAETAIRTIASGAVPNVKISY